MLERKASEEVAGVCYSYSDRKAEEARRKMARETEERRRREERAREQRDRSAPEKERELARA